MDKETEWAVSEVDLTQIALELRAERKLDETTRILAVHGGHINAERLLDLFRPANLVELSLAEAGQDVRPGASDTMRNPSDIYELAGQHRPMIMLLFAGSAIPAGLDLGTLLVTLPGSAVLVIAYADASWARSAEMMPAILTALKLPIDPERAANVSLDSALQLIESISARAGSILITRSARDFRTLEITATPVSDRVDTLSQGESYIRVQPEVYNLRSDLLVQLTEHANSRVVLSPKAMVSEFKWASVYGRGVVVTIENQLVKDSLINVYGNQTVFESLVRPPTSRFAYAAKGEHAAVIRNRPAVMLKQRWDSNYGHWVVESLPRMCLLDKQRLNRDEALFVVGKAHSTMESVYIESLGMLGVDRKSIMFTEDDRSFMFEHLIYPHPLTVQPWIKSPRTISFLRSLVAVARDIAPHSVSRAAKKIYVVRDPSSRRKLTNEHEIHETVSAAGFIDVSPARMSFAEQIVAFSNAEIVLGALGAELTNICFSPPGVKLLAFAPVGMQDDFYFDIVCHKGGRYICLHGEGSSADALSTDYAIDARQVPQMIARVQAG
jgi:capsular polysaccharide biosynthesis protein